MLARLNLVSVLLFFCFSPQLWAQTPPVVKFTKASESGGPSVVKLTRNGKLTLHFESGLPLKSKGSDTKPLIFIKATTYPLHVANAQIPQDALLPNYFFCTADLLMNEEGSPKVWVEAGQPSDGNGEAKPKFHTWLALDKKNEATFQLDSEEVKGKIRELYVSVATMDSKYYKFVLNEDTGPEGGRDIAKNYVISEGRDIQDCRKPDKFFKIQITD